MIALLELDQDNAQTDAERRQLARDMVRMMRRQRDLTRYIERDEEAVEGMKAEIEYLKQVLDRDLVLAPLPLHNKAMIIS